MTNSFVPPGGDPQPTAPPQQPLEPTWAPTQPRPSQEMASWAFGLSLVGCLVGPVLPIIFAVIVLNRGKDGRDHGRRMAIAALWISGLWTVVGLAAVVVGVVLGLTETKPEDERATIAPTELRVGHCFDLGPVGEVTSIPVVPCDEPHQTEVFSEFELPNEKTFPGYDAVIADAEAGCAQRFPEFVGAPAKSSELEIHLIYPDEPAWPEWRTVTCTISQPADRPLRGTLRGSKR